MEARKCDHCNKLATQVIVHTFTDGGGQGEFCEEHLIDLVRSLITSDLTKVGNFAQIKSILEWKDPWGNQ